MSRKSSTGRRSFRPHWRVMTWVVLVFNLVMLIWVIAGAASSGKATDCGSLSQQTCQDAQDVGTAIGVTLLIILWVIGAIILGIIWLVTKPSRTCPTCGSGVKKGAFVCRKCGYDFRPATGQAQVTP